MATAAGEGPIRPDTPRRAAVTLKETRHRLAHGGELRPELEYDLLAMFVRNELGAAVTMPALSILFSLACMFWAPINEAILWLLLVIGSKVTLLEACRRFQATPRAEIDVRSWKRRFVICELLNGFTWAGFALVGIASQASPALGFISTSHVFIFATLIVLLAIRMTFAAVVMPILYAGTVPMTLAVLVRLGIMQDPFYYALASMAAGVHVYFVFMAKGLRQTALSMLEYRTEKDALIAELEESKAISDEARHRAEAANLAKSRFLANMSHELRTPLNAIMGFSEVMQNEILGPLENETYRDYAGNIHDSGKHLLHLINEILDLSRIEAGRYELHEEPLRLTDVVEDCQRLLKLRADAKGLQLVEDFADNLPQIWADQRAVRQICLNLMSNALKFTPRGGRITLTIAGMPDGGQLLAVRDTGPGIPKDEIPRVLQAFGQGSLAHQIAEGGTGLGLPIVQNLIELHGGVFELHSELRKGTDAIVIFPKKRVMASMPPLQPRGRESHRGGVAPAAASSRPPKLRSSRPHALSPAG